MVYAVQAYKTKEGKYLILVEDNSKGKNVLYQWCPSGNCIESPTANENIMIQETLSLYPNPASGELFISSAPIGSDISISDMSGRVLLNEKINSENQKIDVSSLKSGVYLAKVGGIVRKINVE
jgi:hypothetical protein